MESTMRLQLSEVGYLTMREWNRARWAYDYAFRFLPWLRVAGYVSFEVEDIRVDSSSAAGIGIPPTKLAYLEISRLMNEINRYDDMEVLAADADGHFLIRDFGREVSTAVARWPMEDKPHKVNALRCGSCEELTLMYRPPRWEGDVIKVDCKCGFSLDEESFTWAVDLIEKEERERRESVGRAGRSAA